MDDATFKDLVESLEQAAAHARGAIVPGLRVHVAAREFDVGAIRRATGLSQEAFARAIGVALGTLRNWEQNRRRPEGPARVLLALVEKRPQIVAEILGTEAA